MASLTAGESGLGFSEPAVHYMSARPIFRLGAWRNGLKYLDATLAEHQESAMNLVDIVTLSIGGATVGLLILLLVMMRTTYVLVRRDQQWPAASADGNETPTGHQ